MVIQLGRKEYLEKEKSIDLGNRSFLEFCLTNELKNRINSFFFQCNKKFL